LRSKENGQTTFWKKKYLHFYDWYIIHGILFIRNVKWNIKGW